MITLINYDSGELEINDGAAPPIRMTRDQANRLVMHARMHTVAQFVEALPKLIEQASVVASLREQFNRLPAVTDRWNFKEKFARLRTLTREAAAGDPSRVVEKIVVE